MEVNAVYNFTTVNVLNTDLFGNTCPVGTDEEFMAFAQAVKDFRLNLAQPCPLPVSNSLIFEIIDKNMSNSGTRPIRDS